MKKNATRFTALSLTAAVALPAAGCSAKLSPADLAGKVIDANADVTSLTYDTNLSLEGTLELTDYSTSSDFTMTMNTESDITMDPLMSHTFGTVGYSMGGESSYAAVETYTESSGDELLTYLSSQDGTWTQNSIELDDDTMKKMKDFSYNEVLQAVKDGSLEAEIQEDTETHNDTECYVLKTSADGSMLYNSMSSAGIDSFASIGVDEDDIEDTSVDVTYYISADTYEPVIVVIDGKEFGNALFAHAFDSSNLGNYSVNLSKFSININFSDYNNVDDIEIPSEAKNADETSDSSLFSNSSSYDSYESETAVPETYSDAEMPSSGDWTQMVFALDDEVWQIPFSYPAISGEWSFNLADYGYTSGYVTNPGDKQYATIQLSSSKYDMDFTVGLINLTESTQDITQNDVWAVSMSIEWADSYPSLTLPGGIHWGSTMEEIEAVYGQPSDDPYYSESNGYYSIEYQTSDYSKQMELTIYDDGGLKAVRLEDYSL